MSPEQTINFIEQLNEIKELYIEVKEAIILAENFDSSSEIYLSPLNELRNSFDHIIRSLTYCEKIDSELAEAKEHLYRAGYDAYEVLAINVASLIVKSVEDFDAVIISTIFPTYYTDIKPNLIETRVELADTRAHKRLNPVSGTKSFTPYKEKITNLIKQLKLCQAQIPSLINFKEKIKNEKLALVKTEKNKGTKNIIIGIMVGIVSGALGIWVYENYLKAEKHKPEINIVDPARLKAN